jgi:hypothetical protein
MLSLMLTACTTTGFSSPNPPVQAGVGSFLMRILGFKKVSKLGEKSESPLRKSGLIGGNLSPVRRNVKRDLQLLGVRPLDFPVNGPFFIHPSRSVVKSLKLG